MRLDLLLRTLLAATLSLAIAACSSTEQNAKPSVQLSQGQQVNLPSATSLGFGLNASQLIEATWDTGKKQRVEQLPVQLQVNGNTLVLAGFSSWGTRILSLNYQDDKITSEVLTGLDGVVPAPEQVLFNLMITLWPVSAWEGPLNEVRWRIVENYNSRSVFDSNDNKIIDVQYSNQDRLAGEIIFHHLIDNYTIKIKTLQFSKT
ncbi:lipoprotein [Vibrio tubiashii]|uniref:DUF3261 domain-containing protein n=1 Tax=Vibrio sp. M260118 TaxID=3020896 RepID=UPI0005383332|nr:lipoprotein [Vibrio tubiashii]